jgi:UrcA family protein
VNHHFNQETTMKFNIKTSNTIIGATVLCASMLIGGSASADMSINPVPAETVKYQELNLNSPAGVAVLYARIHAAAVRVCSSGSRDLSRYREEKACVNEAEARAVKDVNVDGVTAYFEMKSGRKPASFASNLTK